MASLSLALAHILVLSFQPLLPAQRAAAGHFALRRRDLVEAAEFPWLEGGGAVQVVGLRFTCGEVAPSGTVSWELRADVKLCPSSTASGGRGTVQPSSFRHNSP